MALTRDLARQGQVTSLISAPIHAKDMDFFVR